MLLLLLLLMLLLLFYLLMLLQKVAPEGATVVVSVILWEPPWFHAKKCRTGLLWSWWGPPPWAWSWPHTAWDTLALQPAWRTRLWWPRLTWALFRPRRARWTRGRWLCSELLLGFLRSSWCLLNRRFGFLRFEKTLSNCNQFSILIRFE